MEAKAIGIKVPSYFPVPLARVSLRGRPTIMSELHAVNAVTNERISIEEAARRLHDHLYPTCDCLLLAGSFVRGEATASSDLDIVVLYADLPHAYRESLMWEGYPVEVFVHSPPTLRYFFEKVDGPSGAPMLMQMVVEGREIPKATPLSAEMKQVAQAVLQAGPPPLTSEEIEGRRYNITDLVNDIRTPRSRAELTATGAQLYEKLADFYLRAHNLWSASGKMIPRKLHRHSPEIWSQFDVAFEALFCQGDPNLVVALAEEILVRCTSRGFLFEGYHLDAPADFKL